MPSISMYKTWQDLSEPPEKQRTPHWNTGWGTQSRQKCPWKKQAYVFAGCAFALYRLLMGCLKTLLRPKSTILIFLCLSRRRFSGLSHVQRWHEHRGTKIKKFTLHSHTYRRTNLYSLSQQNSNHFFNRRKAEATTSGPGARSSWREPEVAMWHCAVLRLASTGVG